MDAAYTQQTETFQLMVIKLELKIYEINFFENMKNDCIYIVDSEK